MIKWFSNFREFYYIQMEKYARQAISDGVTNPKMLTVLRDSEIFRVLNTHYNKGNDFEVRHALSPLRSEMCFSLNGWLSKYIHRVLKSLRITAARGQSLYHQQRSQPPNPPPGNRWIKQISPS